MTDASRAWGRCPGPGLRHRPHSVLVVLGCGLRAVLGHRSVRARTLRRGGSESRRDIHAPRYTRRKDPPCMPLLHCHLSHRSRCCAKWTTGLPRAFPPRPPRAHHQQEQAGVKAKSNPAEACAEGAGASTCDGPLPTGSPRCSRRASARSGSGGRARRRAGCRATAYGRAVPRGQCAEQHGHVEISQTVGDVHQRSSGHGE